MTAPPEQAETVVFLRALAGVDPVETHISLVFVGTDTVWKLKKAVRLSFLDFSTLEARHRFCDRELSLNAPAALGLYRDVVPVMRGADGRLSLASVEGTVVDWVLRMGRVPASDFLDAMAAEGRLEPPLLDAVADAVAAYHRALPPLPNASTDMRSMAQGNVKAALEAGLPPNAVEAWGTSIDSTLSALAPWLEQRGRDGFIRRAHGDLHLGNLCLWQGMPVLFDALEFDEALATIDLGYDLAFLLMDLEHRVGRYAANRVLNRYVARTGDAALVRGLPAFLSLRALVRAHVAARSGQSKSAESYLTLAIVTLRPVRPMVVAVGGLPGTGKSTLARGLAPNLGRSPGALVVRSDDIRKRRLGVAPEVRLPPSAYAPDVSRTVFCILADIAETAAAAGQAVVADATFMDPEQRTMVEQAAQRACVPFQGFWLQAPLAELEHRVATRTGDASDATVAVLHAAAPNDPGALDWTPIDASDATNALTQARNFLPPRTEPC
jgi:aminoglycoside phosphotransferase family enzyme/predicted kinase